MKELEENRAELRTNLAKAVYDAVCVSIEKRVLDKSAPLLDAHGKKLSGNQILYQV